MRSAIDLIWTRPELHSQHQWIAASLEWEALHLRRTAQIVSVAVVRRPACDRAPCSRCQSRRVKLGNRGAGGQRRLDIGVARLNQLCVHSMLYWRLFRSLSSPAYSAIQSDSRCGQLGVASSRVVQTSGGSQARIEQRPHVFSQPSCSLGRRQRSGRRSLKDSGEF